MSPVQRDSTAGRAYLDLQQMARRRGRPTQELLLTYVLERFLFRLSRSEYRDRLVLKGGMLLAVLGSRRPTGDVDLLARAIDNDVVAIADVVRTVLSVTVDDGVTYEADEMTAQVIRDAALYSGVRLSVPSRIERAKVVLRLDVNVGDPVTPPSGRRRVPGPSRPPVPFARVSAGHRTGGKGRHDDRARGCDDT
ncbi:MAG: nucleotidyl transferase AbiEii/AbiGii toxin family protein [Acidimicrobiales bacterium]